MKKNFYKILVTLLPVILFLIVQGCADDPLPSIYDSATPGNTPPSVTAINPPEAIAAVTQITITGANFSPVAEDNSVYFNGQKAVIVSASNTQLMVVPPNVVSDSVAVKVAVKGAEQFSNIITYKLKPAVEELLKPNGDPIFNDLLIPYGITLDNQNNVYVSAFGPTPGIKKVAPTGVVSDWAPKGVETFWVALKYSSTALYGAKNLRGVWKITENTTPPNQPWGNIPTSFGSSTRIIDIDIDADLNVWATGNNTFIFMFTPGGELKAFPFTATVRSIRVFQNALYVAGNKENIEGIWKFAINGTDLGNEELYFNYTEFDNESQINAITFSEDGDLLLGTNRAVDPVILVGQNKSAASLYAGAIQAGTEISNFAWDTGNFLYYTRSAANGLTQSVLKINMQKPGAPHYGR